MTDDKKVRSGKYEEEGGTKSDKIVKVRRKKVRSKIITKDRRGCVKTKVVGGREFCI